MTRPVPDNPDLSQAERIDQICTAFEAAWKARETPSLEDWLGDAPAADHRPLLKELLLVEVYYRRRRGETLNADEYRRRFPELEEGCLTELIGAATPQPAGQTTVAPTEGMATLEPASGTVRYHGDYELAEEIGRGGMGVVYLGRHADLGRTLAIKVLLDRHAGSAELQRRFLEEAHIMGQLQHPGVAPIHEVGRLDDGRPFFSMKQVHGQTLAELLKDRDARLVAREPKPDGVKDEPRNTNPEPQLLSIFEQVCQTVAYAHAQGILHRDLKPANIMVGAFSEVQVMDWGLAKVLRTRDEAPGTDQAPAPGSASPGAGDTAAGRVLGTAAYMAPEQARGEVEHLDERCDVFGLGAILCEILTGKPAFPGDSQLDNHRRAARGDLSEAFARLDGCGAEAELVALAKGCLAAVKEKRPRHAEAVAGALSEYQTHVRERLRRAEIERAEAQVKVAEERKRRRVSLALASVVVATVLAAATAGVWYYQDQAEQAATEADLQTKLAQEKHEKAQSEAGRKAEKAIQATMLAVRKEQLEKALVKEFASIHEQRAALLEKLGDPLTASTLLSDIEQWRALVEQVRESWKRAQFLVMDGHGLLDEALSAQLTKLDAQIKADEQDWKWAKKLDRVREEAGALVEGKWQPWIVKQKYASVFQALNLDVAGGDLSQIADQVKASPLRYALVAALDDWTSNLPQGDSLHARLPELSRRIDADGWRNQVRDRGNWGNTQKLLDLAATAPLEKQTAQILILLANKLQDQGHKAEAAQLLRQALLYHPKDFWLHFTLGYLVPDPVEQVGCFTAALAVRPDNISAHNNLGFALKEKGDLGSAIQHYQKAIALDKNYALAHFNLGFALYVKKDLSGAIQQFHKVLELDKNYAPAHLNLGIALIEKKDLGSAIKHFHQAIALDENYARAHYNLGLALYDNKDLDGAITHYQKAIALEPNNAKAYLNLGSAKAVKKDLDGAIQHFREAIALEPNSAKGHLNLGYVLRQQGKFADALKSLQKGHELGSKQPGWTIPSAQWVKSCARLLELEQQLPAILQGTVQPRDVGEQVELALLCYYTKHHVSAAHFFSAALTKEPQLADQYRYTAACVAVLAATGQSKDADKLAKDEPAKLRQQAFDWLKAELATWKQQLATDPKQANTVRSQLKLWQCDPDLASVRDAKELAQLPEKERKEWQALWAEVANLITEKK